MFPRISKALRQLAWGVIALGVVFSTTAQDRWKSSLYDEAWTSPPDRLFDSEKLIQDFSYAGYHRGEQLIPAIAGPVFDVVADFGADPTGVADSTGAIQAAINAAAGVGGGVVFLRTGTFLVEPPVGQNRALEITSSNIVLRGAGKENTFLLNTSSEMRDKAVIDIKGATPYWFWNSGQAYPITEDLLKPTQRIPVTDTSLFEVGDWILIRMDATDDWITEHGEPLWEGYGSSLGGIAYSRQITEIDALSGELVIDAPTRYALKTRDNSRVFIRNNALEEVGVENLSIGNAEHPGTDWGEADYTDLNKSASDTHASYLIRIRNARNGWIQNVDSFSAAGNAAGSHFLSNGILLTECRGFTVEDCHFQRPQYGGGGGNGYMYRLHNSNECLVRRCIAEFNRHGFVFSKMASSGNVFLDCLDKTTGKATGHTGSYNTSGKASDHHMHFSHSNLIDVCRVDGSWFTAHYRPYGSTPKHNLTAAHTVFWNTEGIASPIGKAVHSQQSRYGYVIGTRGAVTAVETGGHSPEKTAPVDHVEGVAEGNALDPFSLHLDQRRKRLELPSIDAGEDRELFFPHYSLELDGKASFGDSPTVPSGATIEWTQISGPGSAVFADQSAARTAVAFPTSGHYVLECRAKSAHGFDDEDFVDSDRLTVIIFPADIERITLSPTDDTYVRGGAAYESENYGEGNSLWMKNVGNISFERESYLRFDLSSLEGKSVIDAELKLFSLASDSDATGSIDLLENEAWDETSLTWSTRPAVNSVITSWTPASDDFQSFDLTPVVTQPSAASSPLDLRFSITSQANSSTVFQFASREHPEPEKRPRLEIDIQVPVPSYSDWIAQFPQLTAIEKAYDTDPDKDGASNLEEFYRNGNPAVDEESPASFQRSTSGESWEFDLTFRRALPAGAKVQVEHSTSLKQLDWQILPGVEFEIQETIGDVSRWLIRLPNPGDEQSRGFFRIVYALP